VVDDHPAREEPRVLALASAAQQVHGPVVGQDERGLQTGDHHVLVVARVRDDRGAVAVTG
jgi:hypothetical protein